MIRFIGYIFAAVAALIIIGLGAAAAYVGVVSKDLPNYEVLENYQPAVMTRVHAADGRLMAEFATKRRLYLPIQAIPDMVKAAYISAEDKNFYEHFGLDPEGFLRAIANNLKKFGSGKRPEGASTITQQVAKNFLLNSNATLQRKVEEAILAMRIEKAYSKDHILELYLNEIYLGRGAYGIAAAALTYFNKSVNELTLEQIAYLASLPKGPSNYDPFKHTDRAIARRNWVLDRMAENGYISKDDAEVAKKKPLGVTLRGADNYVFGADYFTEEVRRQIVAKYGANTLYEGGLSVRTTLDPQLQFFARQALHNGLIKFDRTYGWRGPFNHMDTIGDWGVPLAAIQGYADLPEWRVAVVLATGKDGVKIGLQPEREISGALSAKRKMGFIPAANMRWAYRMVDAKGRRSTAKDPSGVLSVGDVIFVEPQKGGNDIYALEQFPKIQGAMVVMEPKTGRVLAMIGGFSYSKSEFNRATQAYRQPGSSFKPFVYSAALDNGYTPASVVLDGPVEIDQGAAGIWRPKNFGGTYAGPSTLRYGIEHSRNLMTVRLANDLGMPIVAEYAERFGIYDHLQPVLAMALGAGETTVLRLVSAYAIIANGGRSLDPSLIDRIQDRYGHTIYRHDHRICEQCNVQKWDNQPEPVLIDQRQQVLDPMTAYQITSMMEGVIQRGTGSRLRYLNRTLAGKSGTTNDSKDAWFIAFTPDIVVGVYMGYDTPKSLGAAGTGGSLAAPVDGDFLSHALAGKPDVPFKMPAGMIQVAIDRKTGMRAQPGDPNAFVEAFKPGTGPADVYKVIGATSSFTEGVKVPVTSPQANQAIQSGAGGLY